MSEKLRIVREGIIFKELKIESPSDWGSGDTSVVGVEIDAKKLEVSVTHLLGTMPIVDTLFYALLADPDMRILIRFCQGKKTEKPFRVFTTEATSGCKDVFITVYEPLGNFRVDHTKKVLHISCYDRLNEGFGTMSIVDFIEVAKCLGYTDDMSMDGLLAKAGKVEYLPPRLIEFTAETEYSNQISNILSDEDEPNGGEESAAEADSTAPEELDPNAIQ